MPNGDPSCRVCGRQTKPAVHAGFLFEECSACGFALLAEVHELSDYWVGESEWAESEHYWVGAKKRYFQAALRRLERDVHGRRLLDFGGGVGFFAKLALEEGWDAYSLDVSPTVADAAADRVGRDRAWRGLPDSARGSFDAVSMWCVVAHTTDPLNVLRQATRALRAGGLLWLTTPNFSYHRHYARLRAVLGNPADFAADDHLGQFTERSIRVLLERVGYRDIRVHYEGIVEMCILTRSTSRPLLAAKRAWNRAAYALRRIGGPNVMSELQITARAPVGA